MPSSPSISSRIAIAPEVFRCDDVVEDEMMLELEKSRGSIGPSTGSGRRQLPQQQQQQQQQKEQGDWPETTCEFGTSQWQLLVGYR